MATNKSKYAISADGTNWSNTTVTDGTGVYVGYSTGKNRYKKVGGPFAITTPSPTTPTPPTPTTPTAEAPTIGKLAVINASSQSDADVQKWVAACEKQADHEIARYWGYSLDVEFIAKGQTIPKADIYCGILNNTEEAGALGWHDYQNGVPSIKIFAAECEKYHVPVSSCISHEFAEMIGDLNCNTTVRGFDEQGRACLYFRENADPVEDDSLGYQIDNVHVSDFILPTWFQQGTQGPYDFTRACSKPFQILNGGYMLVSYDNGATWNQIDKFDKANEQHRFWADQHDTTKKGGRWTIYEKVWNGESSALKENEIKPGKDIAGGILWQQKKL